MEEKEQPKAGPAAPQAARSRFEILALAWLVVTAALIAGSVYLLPPKGSFLWKPLKEVGSMPIRPALIVAILVGAGAFLLFKKWMSGRMGWAKPGQGTWVRIFAYVATLALALFAGYTLYQSPGDATSRWWTPDLGQTKILGRELTLRPIVIPSAALFFLLGMLAHALYGRPRWTEFLIETQSELVKVSWPPRKEWIGSSVVVIIVIMTVACFLWGVDEVLTRLMPLLSGF